MFDHNMTKGRRLSKYPPCLRRGLSRLAWHACCVPLGCTAAVPQVSVVSCLSGFGLPELIDRVAAQGATSISVPPAWGLALKFIDSLRGGEDPLQAAREHLGLVSPRPRFVDGNRSHYRQSPLSSQFSLSLYVRIPV